MTFKCRLALQALKSKLTKSVYCFLGLLKMNKGKNGDTCAALHEEG